MSKAEDVKAKRRPNFVEDALFGCPLSEVPKLVPGVVLAILIVLASVYLSDWINRSLGFKSLLSYIMVAIVIGILVRNVFSVPTLFTPGISFCLRKLLRLGIILMGIRLSIYDAAKIGAWGVPIVLFAVVVGLLVTIYFTRLLKLPERLGTLIAVGTGICGASAIVATAPGIKAKDEEVAYAVANITVFGILAMFIYPYLANIIFQGNTVMVGLFSGTSIHETAQVAGAGLIYDQAFGVTVKPTAADVAIVTKLVRNVFMALVIPLMTYVYIRRTATQEGSGGSKVNPLKLFPLFILGFLIMATLRSIGDGGVSATGHAFAFFDVTGWKNVIQAISTWSGYILATAMAGVGLGTSLATLKGMGVKPFYIGLFSATMVGLASILAVLILGPAVRF
ncbi:MAG: putative sulfate exporter family transporter [Chloroflexi bacterium]|nr:putative sulfate exporter family transporter [Chloroflexota bacterium]